MLISKFFLGHVNWSHGLHVLKIFSPRVGLWLCKCPWSRDGLRLGGGLTSGVERIDANAAGTRSRRQSHSERQGSRVTRASPSHKTVGAGEGIYGRLVLFHLLVGPTRLYIRQLGKTDGNEAGDSEGNQESMSDSQHLQPYIQWTCRRPQHPSWECPWASGLNLMKRIQPEFKHGRLLPTPTGQLQASNNPCIMLMGSLAFPEVGLQAI